MFSSPWVISDRADSKAVVIADRHYNRQKPGSRQFVPPGRCVVLWTEGAVWVTSWPFAKYVQHDWAGAWINSCFRNERPDLYLSSRLITEAVAITRWQWPNVPDLGLISFIDPTKVKRKRDFGRCYLKAGFVHAGNTRGGLIAMQLIPDAMPDPMEPRQSQLSLFSLSLPRLP
jgi:hypothetical protein